MHDELMESGGSMPPAVDQAQAAVASGHAMQQIKTAYATAVAVQQPRSLPVVEKRLLDEAMMVGDSAYYGWGAGKDKIEGPSIKLAMVAARCWGNCVTEMQPVQDTPDAWIFTAAFVDLETGFTSMRQFRQSKRSIVYGKHDEERKDDMRFQIGQSKAIRNAVINGVPGWLIDKAIDKAKEGVRTKIAKYINEKGIAAAVDYIISGLVKEGVKEDRILSKCGVAKRTALDIDNIVQLRGDLTALQTGQEAAETLFPFDDDGGAMTADLEKEAAEKAADARPADKTPPPETPPEETPVDQECDDSQDLQLDAYHQAIEQAATPMAIQTIRGELDGDTILDDQQIAGLRRSATTRLKKIESNN